MAMASILAGLKPVIRELAAGETLFASGDATRGFFLVRRGQIRLARFSASGCETLLFVAGPGERFAEASLFVETYHCDARAVAESSVACFPKSAALALLEGDAIARLELTADLARQVMELRSALTLRDVRSARERVLGYLVARTGVDGRTIAIGGPLKDIAAMIEAQTDFLRRAVPPSVPFGIGTVFLISSSVKSSISMATRSSNESVSIGNHLDFAKA